jgi:hypothetical protein
MTHILDNKDIERLQQVFVGSNLLERPFALGVWDYQTKRAYEGWCLAHGVLTLAAKIQPQSLEAMPLPLRKAFLEHVGSEPQAEATVETPAVVVETPAETAPIVETPVVEPDAVVVETPPVVEVAAPVEATVVEEVVVETPVEEVTPPVVEPAAVEPEQATPSNGEEKRNLNFKNRNGR